MPAFIIEPLEIVDKPMVDVITIHPPGWTVEPLPPAVIGAPLAAVPEPSWTGVIACMALVVFVAWRAFKAHDNRRGNRKGSQ